MYLWVILVTSRAHWKLTPQVSYRDKSYFNFSNLKVKCVAVCRSHECTYVNVCWFPLLPFNKRNTGTGSQAVTKIQRDPCINELHVTDLKCIAFTQQPIGIRHSFNVSIRIVLSCAKRRQYTYNYSSIYNLFLKKRPCICSLSLQGYHRSC